MFCNTYCKPSVKQGGDFTVKEQKKSSASVKLQCGTLQTFTMTYCKLYCKCTQCQCKTYCNFTILHCKNNVKNNLNKHFQLWQCKFTVLHCKFTVLHRKFKVTQCKCTVCTAKPLLILLNVDKNYNTTL